MRAPLQLVPRRLVEVGGEQGERLQGPELGQVDAQGAGDLAHGLDLGAAADPETEVPTLMAGRTPWLKRSASR